MPHSIEIKAREYLLKKYPYAKPSDNKTFDFIIDDKYAELKGKGAPLNKIDFISLTNKQYNAIGKIDFDIYLVTGLKDNKPEMHKINSKKLLKIQHRKVLSHEYDRKKLREVLK